MQRLEKCRPEGEILVKIQHPGNADASTDGFFFRERLVVKENLVFKLKQVWNVIPVFLSPESALTAVSGDVTARTVKAVYREQAVVCAALAAGELCVVLHRKNFLYGEHGGGFIAACVEALSGDECRSKRAHDACNIGAHNFHACDALEATEHGIVVKGASLYHHMMPQLRGVGELDNLIEGVFDDGVGKSCGDIRHGSALLLRLLYLGIHKYGAAGTKVNGMLREQCLCRKVLHAVI